MVLLEVTDVISLDICIQFINLARYILPTCYMVVAVALSRYGRMQFFSRRLFHARATLKKAIGVLDNAGYAQLQSQFDNPRTIVDAYPNTRTIQDVCLIAAEVRHNCAAASLAEWRGRQSTTRLLEDEDLAQLNHALKMFGSAHSTRIRIAGPTNSSTVQSLLGQAAVLGTKMLSWCNDQRNCVPISFFN